MRTALHVRTELQAVTGRLTGLSGVLSSGTTWCGLFEALDGNCLINNEESADHFPLAGPEQSYTVQHKQQQMRPITNTSRLLLLQNIIINAACTVIVEATFIFFHSDFTAKWILNVMKSSAPSISINTKKQQSVAATKVINRTHCCASPLIRES